MAIEQARSNEARPASATSANGGANRPRNGDAPEGNSFMSVLGAVESTAPQAEAAPDHGNADKAAAGKLDKSRRDAKTGKAGKAGNGEEESASAVTEGGAATPAAASTDNTSATDGASAVAAPAQQPDAMPMTPAEAAAAAIAKAAADAASAAAAVVTAASAASALGAGVVGTAAAIASSMTSALSGTGTSAEGSTDAVAGLATSSLAGTRGRAGAVDADGPAAGKGRKTAADGAVPGTAVDATRSSAAASAARAQASHAALQGQNQQVSAQGSVQTAAQAAAASARAAAADASDATQAAQAAAAAQRQAPTELQAASTALLTTEFNPARRLDRLGDGGAPGAGPANTADSLWNRHALLGDAPAPVAAGPIDTGSTSMEDRMSAQVSYWLSQKTQNAELTLNTADGKPVEVHITLTGNEAQVAFRADAGATRELLGSALPHLKELLGNEGLVLSGVTVNDFGARNQSGTGGGGDDEGRRARSGVRQVMAASEVPGGPVRSGGSGLGTGTGRSLDLYV